MSVQISDPVHSSISLDPLCAKLLDAPEVQRLSGIRQLGLAYLVFPGANHTRLEHSLGACHLAGRLADAVGLDARLRDTVVSAALLHDIGHIPFSHTFETVLKARLGIDHMDRTKSIIEGRTSLDGDATIPDILERHGLKPSEVAALVTGSGRRWKVAGQLIHGTVDADQLDFLVRDAHYTGVAHGVLDLTRLISSLRVHKGAVAVSAKGVPAVEGMLVARGLMYSSVYYHKTIRIASMMMARAVDRALECHGGSTDILDMSDGRFLEWLRSHGEEETVKAVEYRRLPKMAWGLRSMELDDRARKTLASLLSDGADRELEARIAKTAGCRPEDVIVDVPEGSLLLSEPRIHMIDLPVLDDDGKGGKFTLHSPLASAMAVRTVSPWAVIVSARKGDQQKVAKAARKELGLR